MLENQPTRYEITASKNGHTALVGYTPRKSRDGLLAMVRKNGARFAAFTGDDNLLFGAHAADGGVSGGWVIQFTGRTQREALSEGQHPFLA